MCACNTSTFFNHLVVGIAIAQLKLSDKIMRIKNVTHVLNNNWSYFFYYHSSNFYFDFNTPKVNLLVQINLHNKKTWVSTFCSSVDEALGDLAYRRTK